MGRKTIILSFLLIFILCTVFTIAKPQSITENDLSITADKEQYFCEPIFNNLGECLIRAEITVTNLRQNTINLDGITSFSSNIADTDFFNSNGEKMQKDGKNKLKKLQLKKDESYSVFLEFWVKENGKFNYTVNMYQQGNGQLLATTILDPLYNLTISTTNPSWYLINGSFINNQSIYDYAEMVNITTDLNDDSDTTYYPIRLGVPLFLSNMQYYFPSNEISSSSDLNDMSQNKDKLTILPDAFMTTGNDIRTLHTDNTTVLGGAKGIYEDFYNIGLNDFSYCAKVNASNQSGIDYIFSHGSLLISVQYSLAIIDSDLPRCYARDDNDTGFSIYSTTGITDVVDGLTHSICCVRDLSTSNFSIFVDGVYENAYIGHIDNSISNYGDFVINGLGTTNANQFDGMVDEVVLWDKLLTSNDMSYYTNVGAYNESLGNSLQIFFNRIIDINKSYNLKIKLINLDYDYVPLRVYPNINSTHSDYSLFVEEDLNEGINYIPLNSIIFDGYNLPFRISTLFPSDVYVSEVYLIESSNDTTNPVISDCVVNNSYIDCNESIMFSCNIMDDSDVYQSTFKFILQNMTIIEDGIRNPTNTDIWEVEFTQNDLTILLDSFNWSYGSNISFLFDYVNATDITGNTQENYSLNINTNYGCILCFSDWLENLGSCLINDSQIKTYIDNNSCGTYDDLPVDNGTYIYCNYCSEDIVSAYSGDCFWNATDGRINITYSDNNQATCCDLTGIVSDCSILYTPYNESGETSCVYLEDDFVFDLDSEVYFGFGIGGLNSDKTHGKIWINDTNTSYYCLSYVKTLADDLIQTNPPYTKRVAGLVQIMGKEIEDREFFVTQMGLANVYWTSDNLVIDGRQYIFGIECSGGGNRIISEQVSTVGYDPINAPITRFFWIRENILPLTLGLLLLIIVTFVVAWGVKELRGR